MIQKLSILVIAISLLSSCYKDNEEELYPNNFVGIDTTTYFYAKDIQPLVAGNCAFGSCHVSGATLPNLSTYDALKANITRVKVRAVDLKSMPLGGPMSPNNINMLKKWIADGALNN